MTRPLPPRHIIGKEKADRRQRAKRGYSTPDTFSFDTYLAGVIAGGVAELRERAIGHPPELTEEEWDGILDRIAAGYADYVDGKFEWTDIPPTFRDAQDLLTKWWGHLWD